MKKKSLLKTIFLTERAFAALVEWMTAQGWASSVTIVETTNRLGWKGAAGAPSCPKIERTDLPADSPFYQLGIKHLWVQRDWTSCAACAVNNLFQAEVVEACARALDRKDVEKAAKAVLEAGAISDARLETLNEEAVHDVLQPSRRSRVVGLLVSVYSPKAGVPHWNALRQTQTQWVLLDSMLPHPTFVPNIEMWLRGSDIVWPILAVLKDEVENVEDVSFPIAIPMRTPTSKGDPPVRELESELNEFIQGVEPFKEWLPERSPERAPPVVSEMMARECMKMHPGATKEEAMGEMRAMLDRPQRREEKEAAPVEPKAAGAKELRTNVSVVKCVETAHDEGCVLKVFLTESSEEADLRVLSTLEYFSRVSLTPKLLEGGSLERHLVLLMERYEPFTLFIKRKPDDVATFKKLFALLMRVARHGWFLGDIKPDNFVVDVEGERVKRVLAIDIEPAHSSSFQQDSQLMDRMPYESREARQTALTLTYGATMVYLLYRMMKHFNGRQNKHPTVLGEILRELKLYAFALPDYQVVRASHFGAVWCSLVRHYLKKGGQPPSCSEFWEDLRKKISYKHPYSEKPEYRQPHPPFREFKPIDERIQPKELSEATKRLARKALRRELLDVRSATAAVA